MHILVTGGAGYIGSVVTEELIRNGHSVTVFDNLEKGHREAVAPQAEFVEGDLRDGDLLKKVFRQNEIEAVIHLAAYSLVGESVQNPAKYYQNNVVAGLSLLDAMIEENVRKIVFSSTAAVYGEPETQPITETAALAPTNPYGETKLGFEKALRWYEKAFDLKYASLRYFNAAGAGKMCGERHEPETHLIPLVLQAALGKIPHIEIFGEDYHTRDGTCIRDYIHVIDLARAHILALQILDERSAIYNLGCGGTGYTVREVIDTAVSVTGLEIPARIAGKRAGDPAILIASSDKIKRELGWQPEFQDLCLIIESAWSWLKNDLKSTEAKNFASQSTF
jgi:UDP-glucose 4-epimerase